MNNEPTDRVALIDLDGTVADYDKSMNEWQQKLASPTETIPFTRMDHETPWLEARRKLIQRIPGFWKNLQPIQHGFDVVEVMREIGYSLHVLTKGPTSTSNAWGEKLEWCQEYIPDAAVTVSGDKSLVYGRVLFDDFPPYYTAWLRVRPRGLVVCLAHAWNERYAPEGDLTHPQVFRYDGTNKDELVIRLQAAYDRQGGVAA